MTLRQLEYFMVVAQELSFSNAAKKLFVTQPALSRSISSLESELGVALFIRRHPALSLTPAGKVFASELPRLNSELKQIIRATRQTKGCGNTRLSFSRPSSEVWGGLSLHTYLQSRTGNAGAGEIG